MKIDDLFDQYEMLESSEIILVLYVVSSARRDLAENPRTSGFYKRADNWFSYRYEYRDDHPGYTFQEICEYFEFSPDAAQKEIYQLVEVDREYKNQLKIRREQRKKLSEVSGISL